ncbi:MAG: MerR family transcriptional regulator [Lachnospiraceae bacterium]|nr:MerR family transcriptional regulator [Lachnospiraceae bacterium]
MTIKEFAKLCGCNPQTLRYYDQENLLKPVKVDEWSGYRYYDEEQALAFVKIKNLQKAGFKIDEIKALLNKDNRAIYEAFESKIKEEERRLQEIKNIQRSYLTEMEQMQQVIEEVKEKMAKALSTLDISEEFGGDAKTCEEIKNKVMDMFDIDLESGDELHFKDYRECDDEEEVVIEEPEYTDILNNPDWEIVYEKHGWENAKDFICEISDLSAGKEYFVMMAITPDKQKSAMALTSIALSLICDNNFKGEGNTRVIGCNTKDSEDGKNHFWLVRHK